MNNLINLKPGEKPFSGQYQKDDLKFLRIARISRVDYEEGFLDLEWLDHFGERTTIPLSTSFSSQRGTIRGVPEVDSIVICGWIKQSQTLEDPIILSYLDLNYKNSLNYKLTRNKTKEDLKEISTTREKIGYDSKRSKRRKIYPGEIQIESTQGAEITLDENVYLSNNRLSEIEINASDQSIRQSSRQNYISTNGSRIWNGLVTRVPIEGEATTKTTVMPNGQKVQIITDTQLPFHVGGQAYTEHRTEVFEKSNGVLNINEVNSGFDINHMKPYITFIMGTTVGNNKNDVQRYSKVLRPQIFGTTDATTPTIDEMECLPEEFDSLAGAFQLKFSSGSRIDFDKQGHLFTHISASTGQHPLGEGRSWEGSFDGSIKWTVGANIQKGNSIILDTAGGVKETLGFESVKQRSKETIAQKGIYNEVLAPDEDGNAYYIKTTGNLKFAVNGTHESSISNDYVLSVNGKINEDVMGTKNVNIVNDFNSMVGGNYEQVIMKEKNVKIGRSRDVLITGFDVPPLLPTSAADKLTVTLGSREELYTLGSLKRTLTLGDMTATLVAGNIEEDILLGNNTTSVATGDITESISIAGNNETSVTLGDITESIVTGNNEESITAGNKEIKITAGNYTVEIAAGNIEVKTTVGTIDINSVSNAVTVNGLLNVTIQSGTKISNSAPFVSLGSSPAKGGCVTGLPGVPSHLDYITGLPLIGSTTISASI